MLKTVRPLLLPLMFGLMTLPAMAGDLEQPMKKIGFNYKQAVKADDAATMEKYIKEMKAQLDVAKGKNMPAAKKEKFLEGMTEVQSELDAYLPLIPDGSNFKATMTLDYTDDAEKKRQLAQLIGIEDRANVVDAEIVVRFGRPRKT